MLLGVAVQLGAGIRMVLIWIRSVLFWKRSISRRPSTDRNLNVIESHRVGSRRVSSFTSSIDDIVTHMRTELDSHADTCVVGDNALIIHDHERDVAVTGYDHGRAKTFKIVDAVIGYEDPITGQEYYLMINQAIHIPGLKHNLLCPMQLRLNDVSVNEIPKFLITNPTEQDHAITIDLAENDGRLTLPLSIEGVTSYFPSFKPTAAQYESATEGLDLLHLTYRDPEWDPHDADFSRQEDAMLGHDGLVRDNIKRFSRNLFPVSIVQEEALFHTFTEQLTDNRQINSIRSRLPTDDRGQNDSPRRNDLISFSVAAMSSMAKPKMDPALLAKRWGIGLQAAKNTLKKTTQRAIRTVLHPSLARRFRTNDRQLRYRRLPLDIFTDTLITKVPSRRGNKYCQVFGASNGWKRCFPIKAKSEAHHALSLLFQRDGAPPRMIMDGAKEEIEGEFKRKCREAQVHCRQIEPHSPWSDAAETIVKEVKNGTARQMFRSKAPKRLWDDCVEFIAYQQSNTWNNRYVNQDEVPETVMSGQTSDISIWVQHEWYDWVKFRDTAIPFPDDKEALGRYLGPSIDVGPAMTAKILKANGEVVHRSTYRPLTDEEIADENERKDRDKFDQVVNERYGMPMVAADFEGPEDVEATPPDLYEDDSGEKHEHVPDAEDITPETGDEYVGAEVNMSRGGVMRSGRVTGRKRNADGSLQGTRNDNPILDTRTYEVEFPDGEVTEYTANVIAENMWSQCDIAGRQQVLLDAIVDHKFTGEAVKFADRYVYIDGRRYPRKSTKGILLLCQFKDGSQAWERLADLKESYPIEIAEYAVSRGIDHEVAFAWWVPYVLKRRNRIIAAVAKRHTKKNFQFGIEVPTDLADAIRIDRKNGNTLWQDAIKAEMDTVKVAFRVLEPDEEIPPGYQQIECHLVFTVKMENFRRKARYVAGGHVTDAPATLTYASVISRETVRVALTIAALNALEVRTADVEGAYLTAPNLEKIWVILGPEFGPDAGKKAIVVRALYGLKSAGASYHSVMADCMSQLGYTSCKADPDLWMKAATRPDDGQKYWTYVLFYVDDCLAIDCDAEGVLREIDRFFKMKPGSIGRPDLYLGSKLREHTLPNGVKAWGKSPSKYIREAVQHVEEHLKTAGLPGLKKRPGAPFPVGYHPELDTTEVLGPEDASYYMSQIGILRWCVELGRVDIITEVSELASFSAMPRQGHLDTVFHLFAYLKAKHNSTMIFDPTYPATDEGSFKVVDWHEFYGDVHEPIPPNAPEARGKEVEISLFVDASHADDKKTRRSRSGYILYVNMAPIAWLSKKQATVETSVFGAEFVAMKLGVEHSRSLRYKLRMMGVPITGPTNVYGDNMSVIHNTQRPESTLKKKNHSICYHFIREAAAMNEIRTAHVDTNENPADIATKIIPKGTKRDHLVSLILWDIADAHERE